jgi:hypothetical protein
MRKNCLLDLAPLVLTGRATTLLAVAGVTLLTPGETTAQNNPLIGHWISSSRSQDPGDQRGWAYDLRFSPDGRAVLSLIVANGVGSVDFNYRMTGPGSYEAVAVDYRPKQFCTMICTPARPFIPMGTRLRCNFGFENQATLDVRCNNGPVDQYTRQP